ncbi:DUF3027 family protein [Kribbella voronezhensis]|uniref:DUF3027 family protein n=1 Tax=Kribbella voronezhensis TaxID=2512212 RepID=A0A4R7TFX1_9ACTN|nr:DUF3027 domain-containing protein [Kribbella voronezhensis]TDU91094.1 DUF3027 family protein [Kribbella voronezhensis]
MTPVKTPEPVRAKPDAICVAAVEPAREAAIAEAGAAQVGEHLGHLVEGERLVTHYFASTHPGYRGWRWAVTVTRASRAKTVTVNEVVMLPGDEAIVAPEWVPWSERVQPGDLRPGDLFPTLPDDPRLEPGFTDTGAPDDVLAVVEELGLGRERVLSQEGREEAAERWYAGDFGPSSAIAQAVPYKCYSCGYWIRLNDSLGQAFGACANEMAPGDGRIVSYDYGCGAHSDVVIDAPDHPSTEHAFDTTGYDDLAMETVAEADGVQDEPDVVQDEADVVQEATDEADAVQAEVEAAAEPPSDDEVEASSAEDDEIPMPTAEEIAAEATANY